MGVSTKRYRLLLDEGSSCLECYIDPQKRQGYAQVYQEIRRYGVVDLTVLTEMGVYRDDWEVKAHYMQYKQPAQQVLDELLKQYEINID